MTKKDKVIVSDIDGNIITQDMRDYWLISEILDAGTPTKEAEESGEVETWDRNRDGSPVKVPLSTCIEANWDCVDCRKQAVKMCLCDMEIRCWYHTNKHTKDSMEIVVKE